MKEPKRAPFHNTGELIVDEETVKRCVVTVLRDSKTMFRKETDLIICGICGAIISYKAKYCSGCGSKFKKVSLEELKKLTAAVEEQERQNEALEKNQLNIFDVMKGTEEEIESVKE